MGKHLLEVNNLHVAFRNGNEKAVQVVEGVSFYVDRGEVVGIVGESGSGKSVSLMSIAKLIQMPPGEISGGKILLDGQNLMDMEQDSEEIRKIRGKHISYIFQEPMTSLNPVLTIGKQITESILLHSELNRAEADKKAIDLLGKVGIPDAESRFHYYPTQFPGGMRQRIMIAMAMASDPDVLIADEATTALDVTMQEQILDLLVKITKETNTALIIVTHNLSVVARYAERVYVMYAGGIVEQGTVDEIFYDSAHPYTRGLLAAIPRLDGNKEERLIPLAGNPVDVSKKDSHCSFRNRCSYACTECETKDRPPLNVYSSTHAAACYKAKDELTNSIRGKNVVEKKNISGEVLVEISGVKKYFPVYKGAFKKKIADVKALDDINLKIYKGETLGLVGESGCGKTTLSKVILQIYEATEGKVFFKGHDITGQKEHQLRTVRRDMQFIFQDPYGSLDPRQCVGASIGEPLLAHKLVSGKEEYEQKVNELMELCGLNPEMRNRFPHEFSGGQRQRVGIARALASYPEFIICDEPISALDVSIQAQVINLLIDIQKTRGLTYLFVAHDLSVVRHISDRIVVMYMGKIMEISPAEELYSNTLHPYTKALLSAIPIPDPEVERKRKREKISGEIPSLVNRPKGCVFSSRCPYATDHCRKENPRMREFGNGHFAACHVL